MSAISHSHIYTHTSTHTQSGFTGSDRHTVNISPTRQYDYTTVNVGEQHRVLLFSHDVLNVCAKCFLFKNGLNLSF